MQIAASRHDAREFYTCRQPNLQFWFALAFKWLAAAWKQLETRSKGCAKLRQTFPFSRPFLCLHFSMEIRSSFDHNCAINSIRFCARDFLRIALFWFFRIFKLSFRGNLNYADGQSLSELIWGRRFIEEAWVKWSITLTDRNGRHRVSGAFKFFNPLFPDSPASAAISFLVVGVAICAFSSEEAISDIGDNVLDGCVLSCHKGPATELRVMLGVFWAHGFSPASFSLSLSFISGDVCRFSLALTQIPLKQLF